MNKRQLRLNLLFTALASIAALGLNFYMAPLLSSRLGNAAYGFVGMANDFVTYATIVSSILNSVAARFISVEVHQGHIDIASRYYSSLFIANTLLAVFLLILGCTFVWQMDRLLQIPAELVADVKFTFFLTFLNYGIVLMSSIFSVCTYVTNRLDIAGARTCISYAIRFVSLLALFRFAGVRLYYVALSMICASLFLAAANFRLTHRLLPFLHFDIHAFKAKYIRTLALSGVWMAFSSLSQVLMTGLDSVITNTFLGADAMGILGLSRTIPNAMSSAISSLGVIFTPNFVKLYAQKQKQALIDAAKQSIRVLGLVLGVPAMGVLMFGRQFYTLWLPGRTPSEIDLIYLLSVLATMQSLFNLLTVSLAQLSVVTNKLHAPVTVSVSLGVANIIIVFAFLHFTSFGLYAVAGVSSVLFALRYLLFNPLYGAYVLGAKWYTFLPSIWGMILPLLLLGIIYHVLASLITVRTWLGFLLLAAAAGAFGYAFVGLYTWLAGKLRRA